jgi:hypothetical protein
MLHLPSPSYFFSQWLLQLLLFFACVLKNSNRLLYWEVASVLLIGKKTKDREKIRKEKHCWKIATSPAFVYRPPTAKIRKS